MKQCRICEKEKELKDFHKKKSGKYWVMAICKNCRKIIEKDYIQNYKNIQKERYNKDIEISRENGRIKYQKNKEKIKERARKYYKDNREQEINRVLKYIKTNKWAELNRIRSSDRRWKIKSTSDNTINIQATQKLLEEQWWVCNMCWIDITNRWERHLDHIKPLSKQWIHSIDNVQWLCVRCNLTKSNKYE